MRIGITVHFQFSFFSAGSPQTALAIAETYKTAGHEVFFVNVGDSGATWWDDVKGIGEGWTGTCVQHGALAAGAQGPQADLAIEIGNHLLTPEERKAFKKTVWFCRKPLLYHDVEASLFPFEKGHRNLEGVSEVWMNNEHSTSDDVQYAEILLRKPVRLLPFTWTPSGVEMHRQEIKSPLWLQVSQLPEYKDRPWSIHVCETNTSSASSCTIPLLIMREVRKKTDLALSPIVKIHNADNIKQTEFFRYNVLAHVFSDIPDISGTFIGRQRIIDFVYDPKSIVVAHSRFLKIRPYLIDALWFGIPLVHNSECLAALGGMAADGFYPDNELGRGKEAFLRVVQKGLVNPLDALVEVRKQITDRYTPLSRAIQDAWGAAAVGALARPEAVEAVAAAAEAQPAAKPRITVGFSDMWDGFRADYNVFTLMLAAAAPTHEIVGVDAAVASGQMNLVVFGPFGSAWKGLPASIPKVHYTGENSEPVVDPSVKLNLGYKHLQGNEGNYMRLPLWMLSIDWFHCDTERINNPKPIPIGTATGTGAGAGAARSKFCAFVVTNPRQPMRNAAFQWLSAYKRVDSAGRLYNNIGDSIFAGLGGGGGELKKLEFLSNYKFCLAYENESTPGYTTEKLLHAKAAGCVPIYWGDPKVERDFDTKGFIDARSVTTSGELIRLVKELDENPARWSAAAAVPALDEVRRDTVRRTLAECAKRMLGLAGCDAKVLEDVPRMIGFTESPTGADAAAAARIVPPPVAPSNASLAETVFVTGCNARFLPSLQIWLNSVNQMKDGAKAATATVYLMDDVTADVESQLTSSFPFAQFKRFPTAAATPAPADFQDLWAPEHFAWKIWLMREVANAPWAAGKLVLYMDSGAMILRWPQAWLKAARDYGMCVLEDSREFNKYRCHGAFIKEMAITQDELAAHQIWAGSMSFVGGHELAVKVLEEAWTWAQKRDVIAGPKWTGQIIDGHRFGHRHDQSILSVLAKRLKVPAFPLDLVYGDVSVRHTFMTGKALYVHRGLFKVHQPIAEGLDEPWIINMDRRADRLEKFSKNHPELAGRVMRLPAFEGVKLTLTPRIARLFAPHDFNWKKPVMGCALSHLAIWTQLANEREDIGNYLILEDDARLAPGWREAWEKAADEKALPADWDVVYLGGVLPPNREAFESCVEKINPYVGRVRENTIFGQNPANRYFHFCAYAYVLTRRGAQKILEVLKAKGGYWTSADHMICNIQQFLNIYFLHPLVAGCYQDDDPAYKNSQFNDFSRVDTFDSDLWNNKERFSDAEVGAVLDKSAPLDIVGALEDARTAMLAATAAAPAAPAPAPTTPQTPFTQVQEVQEVQAPQAQQLIGKRQIVCIGHPMDSSKWMEFEWLKRVLGPDVNMNVLEMSPGDAPTTPPIVFLQRPHVEDARKTLMKWSAQGGKFYILHLSDEYGTDPIDFYQWPACLGVIRNYIRPDLPNNVLVLPLGFHWSIPRCEPSIHTPRPPFREFVWSFVGTDWQGRKDNLAVLKGIPGDNKCVFMDGWNSPAMLGREESLAILLNSWHVPCPRGQNPETFRIYEALEAGAVPVLVKEEGTEAFLQWFVGQLPLLVADNWNHAAQLIHTLKEKPEVYEQYRNQLLAGWEAMKKRCEEGAKKMLGL